MASGFGKKEDSNPKGREQKIEDAWKELEKGRSVSLSAIRPLSLGCISAFIFPEGSYPAQRAVALFATFSSVPDWSLFIITTGVHAANPQELIVELDREKALVQSIINLNFK